MHNLSYLSRDGGLGLANPDDELLYNTNARYYRIIFFTFNLVLWFRN